jgi:hypothetical protein
MRIARRNARAALAALTAVTATVAAISLSGLTAAPASAAQDITMSLSPASGSDYTTDAATLSWTVPSGCDGQIVGAFIYAGSDPWNLAAINTALGNNGGQNTYFDFALAFNATATGTASWPNVSTGYVPEGTQNTPLYTTTAQLVQALGTGTYTIAIACANGTTAAPILDSSGNPIAGSMLLQIGTTGNSWAVSPAVGTAVNLTGSGTAGANGNTVSLTADVTASDGTVPVGGVNFYAGGTGNALNGSTPVAVGANGEAPFSGNSGYSSGFSGAQSYTAQFVPANPALYVGSSATANIDLIKDNVTITVSAKQDAKSPAAVDITAQAVGSPTPLSTALPGGGVVFFVDGTEYTRPGSESQPFPLNSSGIATDTVTGLKSVTHTITAQLAALGGIVLGPSAGYAVTVNTVQQATGAYASATAVSVAQTDQGLQVTATVTGNTLSGQSVSLVPAGTVTVKEGTVTLGSAKLSGKTGSGVATGTVTGYSLPKGTDVFTAAFAPSNADFGKSAGTGQLTVPVAVTWVRPGSPVIAGKAAVGDTLTVKPGTWSPARAHLAYQWYANGSKIGGATHGTLVLGLAQFGKAISVDVTGSSAGDRSVSVFSPATGKVGKGTLRSSRPKITGTAKVGDTLRASAGSWTPGTRFSFQWYANGKAIGGAKGSSLKLAAALRGKRISVAVTGTKTDYNTVTVMSAQTGRVA